jgi:hypothetical protein
LPAPRDGMHQDSGVDSRRYSLPSSSVRGSLKASNKPGLSGLANKVSLEIERKRHPKAV